MKRGRNVIVSENDFCVKKIDRFRGIVHFEFVSRMRINKTWKKSRRASKPWGHSMKISSIYLRCKDGFSVDRRTILNVEVSA